MNTNNETPYEAQKKDLVEDLEFNIAQAIEYVEEHSEIELSYHDINMALLKILMKNERMIAEADRMFADPNYGARQN